MCGTEIIKNTHTHTRYPPPPTNHELAAFNKKKKEVLVRVDAEYFRPTEVETLLGSPLKAKQKLDWEPTYSFDVKTIFFLIRTMCVWNGWNFRFFIFGSHTSFTNMAAFTNPVPALRSPPVRSISLKNSGAVK